MKGRVNFFLASPKVPPAGRGAPLGALGAKRRMSSARTDLREFRNYGKGGCGLMELGVLLVLFSPPMTLAAKPLAVLP
jgi:hypothetical protein